MVNGQYQPNRALWSMAARSGQKSVYYFCPLSNYFSGVQHLFSCVLEFFWCPNFLCVAELFVCAL